jgi:photosystem II stability/assembly factor-like uncharacterized protein
VHSVAHDPNNANIMFRQEHRGMHRSDDGGDTWHVIEDGLPVGELSDGHRCSFGFASTMDRKAGVVFVVPLEGDNFRFPPNGQLAVYRTQDGKLWRAMKNGLPANHFSAVLRGAIASDQDSGVYFGTASGEVFASSDLGETWQQVARGLPRITSVEAFV